MRKPSSEKKASSRLVPVSASVDQLVFEVEGRELRRLLSRRAARRRELAQRQRTMLSRLVTKSGEHGLNELTRQQLERSIRVHEDYAEFLAFARAHLGRSLGRSRLTPADLRILDLLPERTYD